MKRYWIADFSNSTVIKWKLEPGQTIDEAIRDYLIRQNKGEAKSDRIHFYGKRPVTEEEFNISTARQEK